MTRLIIPPAECARIIDLRRSGVGVKRIAAIVGRSANSIKMFFKRENIAAPKRTAWLSLQHKQPSRWRSELIGWQGHEREVRPVTLYRVSLQNESDDTAAAPSARV